MERRIITIFTPAVVSWLEEQQFPLPQPPFRRLPDGSLWTDDMKNLDWLDEEYGIMQSVFQLIGLKLPGACGLCHFRPVAGIGGDYKVAPHYSIAFDGSYRSLVGKYDELGMLMYPGIAKSATASEYDLEHVTVLIELYHKMPRAVADSLAGTLKTWFDNIGRVGVFGEAGIASLCREMRFKGRKAMFVLDARPSGQETLNTLYLAILHWAMGGRHPLYMIDLAGDPADEVLRDGESVPLV